MRLSRSPAQLRRHEGRQGRAWDAVTVDVVTLVRDVAALAGRSDSVLRPAEENRGLGDVERSRAVLAHLWNMNVVDAWGWLVISRPLSCHPAQMISLGW
jgi:hypothetical protein